MKSFAKNALLTVGSILVVLLVCEIFLRVGGYKFVTFNALSAFHQFDPELGWTQIPHHEGLFQGREFTVNIKTNSHGFRDDEYAFTKPVGSKRVVVLGDSFTWGWGVEHEEIFCEVAERKLEGTEFLNLGQSSYGTTQEYLLLKKLGMQFSPDFTVLAFFPNDIMDNFGQNPKRPTFMLQGGELVLDQNPKPLAFSQKIKKIMSDHFLLYSLIDYRIALLKPLRQNPVAYDGFDNYFFKNFHEKMEGPWDVTKALLVEIDRLTNHRFLIMYIPNRLQVEEETYQQALLVTKVDEESVDLSYTNTLLQEFSERHGIPFLDLTPYFRKGNEHSSLYFQWDSHMTKAGHRLAGEILSDRLENLL